MEIFYEAYNFFKTHGFVHLPHIIAMNNDIDMQDLYYFYDKEKDNKEIIDFMNHYQTEYGLKTIFDSSMSNSVNETIYKVGTLSTGECIICYDDNKVGYKTPCNHFMCMECCEKLFQDDKTINKCPYCRENVVLYRMNEIIKIFKNNEEVEVDCEDQVVPNEFIDSFSFIRGRFIDNDELVLTRGTDDELFPLIPDVFLTPPQRPSLIQHYMTRYEFISPSNESDVHHVELPDFTFPRIENGHDVVNPFRIMQRERRIYTNMMGRRNDYPMRSQFDDNHIHQAERPEISNNAPRGNSSRVPINNIIPHRNSSNTNTISRQTTRRLNSRSEINNNNARRNIPRNGRR